MKIFILILFMGTGDGAQPIQVEFTSKEKCEAAAKTINDSYSFQYIAMRYACVEK